MPPMGLSTNVGTWYIECFSMLRAFHLYKITHEYIPTRFGFSLIIKHISSGKAVTEYGLNVTLLKLELFG